MKIKLENETARVSCADIELTNFAKGLFKQTFINLTERLFRAFQFPETFCEAKLNCLSLMKDSRSLQTTFNKNMTAIVIYQGCANG